MFSISVPRGGVIQGEVIQGNTVKLERVLASAGSSTGKHSIQLFEEHPGEQAHQFHSPIPFTSCRFHARRKSFE